MWALTCFVGVTKGETLMTLVPFTVVWLALGCAVLGLAAYRKFVAWYEEDDYVHLRATDAPIVAHQAAINHRLEVVDKWGKILTVAAAALGTALAGIYLYNQWVQSFGPR
jgi:hypothetical protein